MGIVEQIASNEKWQEFIEYKLNNDGFTKEEEKRVTEFVENRRYESFVDLIKNGQFPIDYPKKVIVNKEGSKKKRIVYSFGEEENVILKFIAFYLYEYDNIFYNNCYAFRRGYGARDAIRQFKGNKSFGAKYCYKADISNYFNSIDVDILLSKLEFLKVKDEELFKLFRKILLEDKVYENGKLISEKHGAMAGTPCSPFFANVYLSELDKYFAEHNVSYFRYSDDVLMFADTREELDELIGIFTKMLQENKVSINESKVAYVNPGESFEFLGFKYSDGIIDLSDNTKYKLKSKIKRKADALRRWQRSKNLTSDKAAIGFINAMNRKFYGKDKANWDEDDFTWSRWFFPNISTDKSLKEIDEYMIQYIRYSITGRHYKGNYRITYDKLKEWGYKSLVHEYYAWKKR